MPRALSSGVSGLKVHQAQMDTIGNNIANVNTNAFKSSRMQFKESFSQTLSAASRPTQGGVPGGIDPQQVGLGVEIGSIDTQFTQGSFENTGLPSDLAISGPSFFVLTNGGTSRMYTRAGDFKVDANGSLVSATNGMNVMGRMATNGVLVDSLVPLKIPLGANVPALPTSTIDATGNLPASAAAGATVTSTQTVYDSMGVSHMLQVTYTKAAAPSAGAAATWNIAANFDGASVAGFSGVADFDSTGALIPPGAMPVVSVTPTNGAATMNITLNEGVGLAGLTNLAGTATAAMKNQNGYQSGTLQDFTIDRAGIVTGQFSNGTLQVIGQVALADFNNPGGLSKDAGGVYSESANSGGADVSYAMAGARSTIQSGALEGSNVDLAEQFTKMITAQRGFQANAKIITTSDEMLQELTQLKR